MAHGGGMPLPTQGSRVGAGPLSVNDPPGSTGRPARTRSGEHKPRKPASRRASGPAMRSTAAASRSSAESWFGRFIPRRRPIVGDHRLTRRNVYVLPSRAGLLFATVLLTMLICAINYGLAMGYALSFLIFGVVVVAMMHTFRNLSALVLRPGRAEPVFAGQSADLSIVLINPSRLARYALNVNAESMNHGEQVDIAAQTEQLVRISLPTWQRGWMPVPRLTLSTRYPLGIWRVWSYWQPAQHVLVYPDPESPAHPLPLSRTSQGDEQGSGGTDEDLAAIRPFVVGDSPRRIAWSAIARTGSDELLTKQFEGGGVGELMLDYTQLPAHLGLEDRLSRLTRWVLDAEATGARYELRLPDRSIDCDNGLVHQTACLEALAQYGVQTPDSTQDRPA